MISAFEDIRGLSVTIMGLGLNGGGLAAAVFFCEHGAKVTVTDLKTAEMLAPSVAALEKYRNIRFVLGEHRIEDFSSADAVIKNPGVKLQGNPYLAAARCIETDLSIFLRLTKAPVIAVTGTKGKSSTVSAIHYGLKQCGIPAFLGGNITVSPLTFLHQTTEKTPVVLELSSWQLADLGTSRLLNPKIAVITSIMPDHQNWYGAMEPYVADKKLIYQNQQKDSYTLCNYDDEWGKVFAQETGGSVFWYSKHPLPEYLCGAWIAEDGSAWLRRSAGDEVQLLPQEIAVPGRILKQNVMTAAMTLVLYGIEPARVSACMKDFGGIEHRLECFHTCGKTRFYNDTAATIPEAVIAAVDAFASSDEQLVLITGGTDKQLDFTPLIPHLAKPEQLFLLAGTGTDKLLPLLDAAGIPYHGAFANLDMLLDAVQAQTDTTEKQAVVFSPGTASFGLFKNEFDRGNQFKEKVKNRW